jgi:uncharacterized protein YdaU (DUF1376 family)
MSTKSLTMDQINLALQVGQYQRPYMRLYIDDLRCGMRGMTFEQAGQYILALIYQTATGQPLRNDAESARQMSDYYRLKKFTPKKIQRMMSDLLPGGEFPKFVEHEPGSGNHWNPRTVRENADFVRRQIAKTERKSNENRSIIARKIDRLSNDSDTKNPIKSTDVDKKNGHTRAHQSQSYIEEVEGYSDSPQLGDSPHTADSPLLPSDKSSGSLSIPPSGAIAPTDKRAKAREREQEREKLKAAKAREVAPRCARAYNDWIEHYGVGAKLQRLTSERAKQIFARLDEWRIAMGKKPSETTVDDYVAWFDQALEKVAYSAFLMGQTDANFKLTFDFLGRKSRFMKLMEGGYGNGAAARRQPPKRQLLDMPTMGIRMGADGKPVETVQ